MEIFTCTACENFSTTEEVLLVAHQGYVCTKIDAESAQYRQNLLPLFVPQEHIEQVVALAKSHGER